MATAAEPMCGGASFDPRQAVLKVIPGRTLISYGGQVQHILVCEQVPDWRSHGVQGYASTASRATSAWVGGGRYSIVTLAEARDKALENARAVAQGSEPRDRSRVPTFKQAAERVIRLYKPTWRTEGGSSSERVWRSTRERLVYPEIGDMPISAIFSGTGSGRSLAEREPVTAPGETLNPGSARAARSGRGACERHRVGVLAHFAASIRHRGGGAVLWAGGRRLPVAVDVHVRVAHCDAARR